MKTIELNNLGCAQAYYVSPDAKLIEINVQGLLCGSSKITRFEVLDEDDPDDWE